MCRLTCLSILLLIPAAFSFQSSTKKSVHITCSKFNSAITPPITSTSTSTSLQSTVDETATDTTTKTKKTWFPIRPADALSPSNDYNSLVNSAYLRHILVETEEMADLVMNLYLNGGKSEGDDNDAAQSSYERTDGDVFSRLATDVSTCPFTREDSGEIGWVDNPLNNREKSDLNDVYADILSSEAIEDLFSRRVKGGDVIKVEGKEGWHLIRVDDLFIKLVGDTDTTADGSKNRINKVRPKLKGSGQIPLSPVFQKIGTDADIIDSNDGIDNDDEQSKMIYSVPNAKHYQILTSGCQMNVADSERIMGVLEGELGLTALDAINTADPTLITTSNKKSKNKKKPTPDILLLNTCTIRDHAEQKVYDALGPYTAMKRAGKPLAIVVAGCVAQQEGEALLRRFPEIDLVLGPQYIPWLGELLVEVGKGSQLCMTESMIWSEKGGSLAIDKDSSREKDGDWMTPIKRGHSVRAWVNVIYGCNEHCTYCVVPSVRGVEQSRSMEAILQECLQLAASGYKEVTLLGQNIDAYGRDMIPKRTFADLLHYLNDNLPPNTISRIRYVTSHPRYFSERVIDAVANLDKVCECFHMPFQAGDDEVLRGMRRGYTFDSYMKIIQKIRAKAPDASICGDVIVGFPGETEEAFQRTLDLMEEVKFDNLNTFAYSPRPNTEAANWENQIPPEVQSERLQRVQALAAKHALERSERYVGKVIEVLVEDRTPKMAERLWEEQDKAGKSFSKETLMN
ncbi:tRNA A37 methylthiotransferase [Skeletonema marinoi]|uniref:tRNA A37 methylthiotransferase n=1 Tax=Skeletonema marinoi TaxID=267567 RepID=A0AAD9DDC0_9STRA|nr:tRNA A37 methylthiotransferase [Skeletonema marinoi]